MVHIVVTSTMSKPSKELRMAVEFGILIYFPLWFTIKRQKKYFTDGTKNYHQMIRVISVFPNKAGCVISMKNALQNSTWAHPKNVLVAMLAVDYYEIRNTAINRILNPEEKWKRQK